MAKPASGRFSGLYGMAAHTADELFAWADRLDAQAADPSSTDDPRWLRRRVEKLRHVAEMKAKAIEHKSDQQSERH